MVLSSGKTNESIYKLYERKQFLITNNLILINMEAIATKVCRKCGRELPVTEFTKKTNAKDGLQYYCKECNSKASTESARKRREKLKAQKVERERVEYENKYKIYTNRELAKFTPRELMLELKARGYEGELIFREVKVTEHRINLNKLD